MRDIAIIWSLQAREALSAKKLKNVAYRVIDSVCETVNLRHSPTYATQIQTACNELLDDHGAAVVGKLTALSSALSRAVTIAGRDLPGPRDALEYWRYVRTISPEVCESLTEHCRAGEVKVNLIPEVIPRELREQYEAQQKSHRAMAEAEKRHSEKKAKEKKAQSFQDAMAAQERKRAQERRKTKQEKPPARKGTVSSPPEDSVRRVGGTAVRARSKPRATNPVRRGGGTRVVHRSDPSQKPTERGTNETVASPTRKKRNVNVGGAALVRMAARKKTVPVPSNSREL